MRRDLGWDGEELHAGGARFHKFSSSIRRYEKRHSNFSAHCSPAFRVRDGDTVVCGQCRCVHVKDTRASYYPGYVALDGVLCSK